MTQKIDQFAKLHGLATLEAKLVKGMLHVPNSVVHATTASGDSVKHDWISGAITAVEPIALSVVQNLIDIAILSITERKALVDLIQNNLQQDNISAVLLEIKKTKFVPLMVGKLRNDVQSVSELLAELSNTVFVAASTELIEGLQTQLDDDDDLGGSRLEIEFDDDRTARNLTVFGVPLKTHIELLFASVFTEFWFTSVLSAAILNSNSMNDVLAKISQYAKIKVEQQLTTLLKNVVFNVAQEAVLRANAQLNELRVDSDDYIEDSEREVI